MQNITELRKSLSENYENMIKGEMPIGLGKELSNAAGKIINTLKVELEYQALLGKKEPIEFLERPTK
jgi:hypothetical protein